MQALLNMSSKQVAIASGAVAAFSCAVLSENKTAKKIATFALYFSFATCGVSTFFWGVEKAFLPLKTT